MMRFSFDEVFSVTDRIGLCASLGLTGVDLVTGSLLTPGLLD